MGWLNSVPMWNSKLCCFPFALFLNCEYFFLMEQLLMCKKDSVFENKRKWDRGDMLGDLCLGLRLENKTHLCKLWISFYSQESGDEITEKGPKRTWVMEKIWNLALHERRSRETNSCDMTKRSFVNRNI